MDITIRHIDSNDYNGYLELLFELSQYKHNIDKLSFDNLLTNKNCIILVIEFDNKIIGAGSLFILNKLHCNPFGQIEDVVIKKEYRHLGLGKKIINQLVSIGKTKNCYKIVLNCLKNNIEFYNKCGFIEAGFQFKIIT